jgi:FMN phosphatase YigB (HAD superfamily)
MTPSPVAFLLDVDNTLLDNDRIQADLKEHLEREYGREARERYWAIFLELFDHEVGYADYLGALQRYRLEHPHDMKLLRMSSWLVDYPFAERLYPQALEVIAHLKKSGPVVLVSDGDVVFQPRKVERSGLAPAVDWRVLIYVHKERELPDLEQHYPAERYVLVDDKLRILTAAKQVWGQRITTVWPRQGHYAFAPDVGTYPQPDVTIEKIGDLLSRESSVLGRR